MARNGSGTYSKVNTFVAGNTITAAGHNQNWDDLVSEMTNSVAADGQTTLTGAIKGANGSLAAPGYSFASDPDTGMFRIAANQVGIGAGGQTVFAIGTATTSMVGVFAPTALSAALVNTQAIATGAVTPVKLAASAIAPATGMINGTIVESHAGNAVTFEVRTLAGTVPTATDSVFMVFRNTTAGTGDFTVITVTATLSLTISSGSTMGFTSGSPGRLWLAAFNNAGVASLAAINCLNGTGVYPLQGFGIASTTAEGGAGAADSAHVFYSVGAISSKAYIPLGYATWDVGGTLGTAGTWGSSPTRIQLIDPSVPLPGREVQTQENFTGAVASGSTSIPLDDTIPLTSEGTLFLTQAVTPTSGANLLRISALLNLSSGSGETTAISLIQDGTGTSLAVNAYDISTGPIQGCPLRYSMKASTVSSTTFTIRAGSNGAATITFNGQAAARKYGGVLSSFISVSEVMA